jgi:transcriptional regulator with XRE-family HTH domain
LFWSAWSWTTRLAQDDEVHGGFGMLLREHRSAAGLTQEDLAQRSGVSIRAIADMERGRTARPFRNSVRRLADAMALRGADREQLEMAAARSAVAAIFITAGQGASGSLTSQKLLTSVREAGGGRENVPRQLPPSSADFVGRTSELRVLSGALARRDRAGETVILGIVGTAGVGKTVLAVHWAHQIADRFPDGQLYVDLQGFDPSTDPLAPADVIAGFLHSLGLSSAQVPPSAHAAAGMYRSLLAGLRMLIVLDNARDPEQVRPLLPGNPACTVVVTSRNRLTGLVVAQGARPLYLDILTWADALELLTRRLGAKRLAEEPQAAKDLIGLSARLPLALAVVAARAAASPRMPLRDVVADLRESDRPLDAVETGEPTTSLRAMLSGSYRQLSDPAASMLGLLGLLSAPGFTAGAAASLAGIPVGQARALLHELVRSSLVTGHYPADQFALPAFVRSYAAERATAVDGVPELTVPRSNGHNGHARP